MYYYYLYAMYSYSFCVNYWIDIYLNKKIEFDIKQLWYAFKLSKLIKI